ncbi:uncharacterized protein LOC124309525 isoform X1 [Neodiprion virginianus]|uniref:uncharacterized protein LOC124309525 isoform X1 n=1 Tax=Neodiprion virginianus TaxID=2961670 RepID=UPI001EE7441D|nr:uncharacterized protein LOC124309525 isoform X1 [Neodiprion virginianus]XP_046629156.1 uncharacterized protein LOC124309525 isoform X1 [Neodiprion virginianus]
MPKSDRSPNDDEIQEPGFRGSPFERRGRRRISRVGRVGRKPSGGFRSNGSNRETELPTVVQRRSSAILVAQAARALGVSLIRSYVGIIYKCASCVMGMFKWLRKFSLCERILPESSYNKCTGTPDFEYIARGDFVQWDRNRRSLPSPNQRGLNNDQDRKSTLTVVLERRRHRGTDSNDLCRLSQSEDTNEAHSSVSGSLNSLNCTEDRASSEAYRSALQAFLDRRREPAEGSEGGHSPKLSPTKNRVEIFRNNTNSEKQPEYENPPIPGVPHVEASELFEVGWVAGTEDRYLELIAAEWQNTRTALRRSSHPDCFTAVRADLNVLTEIRHPHTLLLMGTTRTDEHGIVAIFESVDCTLYNYVHEQGERVSVQGAARCAGQLADALRHAHARGIIHGALSSHCVFLAASGTAKLGGWELAVREKEPRPYREWEERLRTEIFKWQAPEMFYGDAPSRACDVYALALLIWEMCTGRIPWNGLDEAEIERQYIHWERRISTDIYNFPPLLNNLLEVGLHLDVNKRNLDMDRTRRFLRRIELRYEEEEPIYVNRQCNNNNPDVKTFNAPVATSPLIKSPMVTTPKRDTNDINNTLMAKKLFNLKKISVDQGGQKNGKNKICSGDACAASDEKNSNMYAETRRKNCGHVSPHETRKAVSEYRERTAGKREKLGHTDEKRQRRATKATSTDIGKKADRNLSKLIVSESSFSESSTAIEITESSDDESGNDTITDLKKLKELIATRRSKFFYGTSSLTNLQALEIPDIPQSSPRTRERILKEAREKSCEPCKPASHKTNFEPLLSKSPIEYNPTLIKPASHQNQRVGQSLLNQEHQPSIPRSQTLNSGSTNFFESSLWRKEKLICLSKMHKDDHSSAQNLSSLDNKQLASKSPESPESDSTYIISNKTPAHDKADFIYPDSVLMTDTTTTEMDASQNRTSETMPLQALKEALDRATIIINSATPNNEKSSQFSPLESPNISDVVFDENGASESIFENLNKSKLYVNNSNEEIKSIERTTNGDRDSLLATEIATKYPITVEDNNEKSRYLSFGQKSGDIFDSMTESKIDDSLVQRQPDFTYSNLNGNNTHDANDSLNCLAEKSLISSATIFLSAKSGEKGCKSCQNRNLLARRRSLPAGLGQFRSVSNVSPLGRLPIRRGEIPDSTVEDLYIDDEFGENLNINMVFLEDENEPDDHDILSSLLQSSEV